MPPLACKKFEISDVRAFVSHKKSLNFTSAEPKVILYAERSSAAFENSIEDKKLHNVIEEIRAIIKKS